uniref:SFRICE_012812 n=1 Tax=Spodoptera frugiperda TaxID=7108 RepID=A0A2H1VUT9_SPOFR
MGGGDCLPSAQLRPVESPVSGQALPISGHSHIDDCCSCIRYTSTYGKERGTFSSPDYPRPYPPRIDCLLYTFVAAPHEIVELVFTDFDIFKEHLE